MARALAILVGTLCCLLLIPCTEQYQNSQTQMLQQLRKQLEYPKLLDAWNYTRDLCYTTPSSSLAVVCKGDVVTELKIIGDKQFKAEKFEGYPILDQTLSQDFSVDSFVTTLARLRSLKVVILVSLGIWGRLPDKIHRLDSLQVLDLSSNYLYGSLPPKISVMDNLQTVTLDGNFFNDTVPDWFGSLTNLRVLSLQRNHLKGPLPASISRVSTLTYLALSSNSISGKIPDLSNLAYLEVLDMRDNELNSELPTMPNGLVTILLNKNSFKGEIPQQFAELMQLQHLDLSFNLLEGSPPARLFGLPNISYLNLASNMLSGSFPNKITCSIQLGFVDISTNRFTGNLPSCLSSDLNKRIVKYDWNCLAIDPRHQHDETYCQVNHMNRRGSKTKNVRLLVSIGAVTVVLLLLLAFVGLCKRNCNRAIGEQHLLPKSVPDNSASGFSSELLASARYISQPIKLGTQVLPTYRVFSVEELREATRNFERSSYIGEGSLGKLYRGILENGTFVAIRCLALFKQYSIRNLNLRLELLSKLRHPHLVCLLGHCIDGAPDDSGDNRVFLVYEYVPNGSLHAHLSNCNPEKVLNWTDRLAVLTGIAKAVHFLHTGIIPGFFKNRLRTNNILLDEHCIAKVSDYGLCIITEEICKYEARAEDKKSIQSKSPATREMVKLEDDVYSFGLILLEALVGPSISEIGEANCCSELAKSLSNQEEGRRILDPTVLNTCSQESLSIVISLTNKCLSSESYTRPSVEDVLWNLQYATQVHATADGDQRLDVVSRV